MMQRTILSPGAISQLDSELSEMNAKNILLVRGNNSFIKSGAEKVIKPIINKFNYVEFSGFSVNPKLEEAQQGFNIFKSMNIDTILAVGGGSVIDMAKIIKYLALKDNKSNLTPKLIAIPTTAGTGSEATHFAVVYIDGLKHSYASPFLLPSVAIVDADLLKGQSKYQMAVSGIDAFAQGIESYWSIHSTKESMSYSEKAIKLIWENLEKAINGDKIAKINIAQGAYWAGKAINITKTTAPHALSYAFSSSLGLPHGHAVALFLPYFIYYHINLDEKDCNDIRGAEHVKNVLSKISHNLQSNPSLLLQTIYKWLQLIGINISFENLEISNDIFNLLIKDVNIDRLNNNPGKCNLSQVKKIYSFNNHSRYL